MKRAILIMVAAIAVTLMIPFGGGDSIQAVVGQQWEEPTLVAPFDVPISKSDALIAEQMAVVSGSIKPVFAIDSSVVGGRLALFGAMLRSVDSLSGEQVSSSLDAMEQVYMSGIISSSEAQSYDGKPIFTVIGGSNELRTNHISHFFTPVSAAQFVAQCMGVLPDVVMPFIETNMSFDERLSSMVRASSVEGISSTQGVVRSGDIIVAKGQVIDEPTLQAISSYNRESVSRLGYSSSLLFLIFGRFFIVLSIFVINYLFFTRFAVHYFGATMREMVFIMALYVVISALVALAARSGGLLSVYIVPLSIVPIYLLTFFNMRVAILGNITVAFLGALFAPSSFGFFIINFLSGMMAIFMMRHFYHRGKLMRALGVIIVSQSLLYICFSLTQKGSFAEIDYFSLVWFVVSGLLFLGFYQLIYFVERMFGFVSDITLLELCDTNQPLLMQLAQNAPGTFQHSVQVANLAESAAKEIGANPLLARTGALYHDIGKMDNPFYFVENLSGSFNPHNDITPRESAVIIKSHVIDGVAIGKRHNLPVSVLNFIESHHGDSLIFFFFDKARKEAEAGVSGAVIEEDFRYGGPKPISREASICMMADVVEAASRSLPSYEKEILNSLVDSIIDTQIGEGQFAMSQLSFEEIGRVKELFKSKLNNIYHGRIAYPSRDV